MHDPKVQTCTAGSGIAQSSIHPNEKTFTGLGADLSLLPQPLLLVPICEWKSPCENTVGNVTILEERRERDPDQPKMSLAVVASRRTRIVGLLVLRRNSALAKGI